MTKEKRAIIVGASSGIGYEVARLLLQEGWRLGLAARRTETLEALRREFQDQVVYAPIDVTQEESEERLLRLIENMTMGTAAVGYLPESMHGAGSPQAQRIMIARQANMEQKKALAKAIARID